MNNLERERLVPVSETDGIPSERGGSHTPRSQRKNPFTRQQRRSLNNRCPCVLLHALLHSSPPRCPLSRLTHLLVSSL